MILRPEAKPVHTDNAFVSAWEAVARAEKTRSAKYHLVRQPDHARVSGEIAQHLAIAGAPPVDDDIVRGISLHDEGWAPFDEGRERLHATPASYSSANIVLDREGRPLAFLDIKAGDFLRAWVGSIDCAEEVAPIAALIVSGHFCRLGKFGISMAAYSEGDAQSVRAFLASEEQRQCRLLRRQSRGESEVQHWTDVLQFCDLLSLYLCCGSEENVEFPQRIGPHGETIQLQVQDGVFVLEPPLFAREVELSVEAHPYPTDAGVTSATVAWRVG
ncbi:MAG TPA: DUF3891 family protein [Terriglobales bacterium]|jgi:hypothetical protein